MPTSNRADSTRSSPEPESTRLETPRGHFAALRWPCTGGPRVLALHGWLDNAASFLPLAGQLKGIDLVAPDLAGHGHSVHRPEAANYYFAENLFDVELMLDALGWANCHLLGHSMGAAVAALYATAAPERVRSLIMLDAMGPVTGDPDQTAARLRRSLANHRQGPRPLKDYPSIAAMAEARLANADDLQPDAARLICERAARPHGDVFRWRTDPRLHWVSPVLMSEAQTLDCLRHIEAPVLSLTAQPFARWAGEEVVRERSAAIVHGTHETVEGGHHFHMDRPEEVGARLLDFLRAVDTQ